MVKKNELFNNDKESMNLLKVMLDGNDQSASPSCSGAQLLLTARLVGKELDETSQAAQALIAVRANVGASDADKADALADMVCETNELSGAIRDIAPELPIPAYVKLAVAYRDSLNAFVVQAKTLPLPVNFDGNLGVLAANLAQANDEAKTMMSLKVAHDLDAKIDAAQDDVVNVIALRTASPQNPVALMAVYNKANGDLVALQANAAHILTHVSTDPSDPLFVFLTGVQTGPVAVLTDIANLIATPAIAAPSFDTDLSAYKAVIAAQDAASDQFKHALDFKNLLSGCGHDLIQDIAHHH